MVGLGWKLFEKYIDLEEDSLHHILIANIFTLLYRSVIHEIILYIDHNSGNW